MRFSRLQKLGAHSGTCAFEHYDRHSSTANGMGLRMQMQIVKLMSALETAERLSTELEQLVDLRDHLRLLQALEVAKRNGYGSRKSARSAYHWPRII
jgi:hypothetical protein